MKLEQALTQIATDLDLDDLIKFAAEDNITGWDDGNGDWPIGAIFGDDGKVLYAIIRAMKPGVVVEFGTGSGCSTKHILSALVKNRKGKLISYDRGATINIKRLTVAEIKRWTLQREEIFGAEMPESADLVFEDAGHDVEGTRKIALLAKGMGAKVILSHDAEHYVVGPTVRQGLSEALGSFKSFLLEGTSCGLAYWIDNGDV